MPDKKLTDAEIVKAFKCCSDINDKCFECPLKDKSRESCVGILMSNALDLINRLQAQNDKLYETIDYRADKITELEDKIKTAKAENERLNKEVDRLSQCVLYHDGQIVDAVKEFAERLKSQYSVFYAYRGGLIKKEIDDLLKNWGVKSNG